MKFTIKDLCIAGVIGALYVVLTLAFAPFAYGPIQIRPAEALTILPVLFFPAVPGVFVGCLVANLLSPYGVWDVVIGSTLTLIAAILSRKFKKNIYLACLPPVLINAFGLPLLWLIMDSTAGYWVNFSSILLTQAVFVYGLGVPLYYSTRKLVPKIYGGNLSV